MNSQVLFEVVFELERFSTFFAFETPQVRGLIVTYHVTLKTIDIRKKFVAHITLHSEKESESQ